MGERQTLAVQTNNTRFTLSTSKISFGYAHGPGSRSLRP